MTSTITPCTCSSMAYGYYIYYDDFASTLYSVHYHFIFQIKYNEQFLPLIGLGDNNPYKKCEDSLTSNGKDYKFFNLTKLSDDRYGEYSIVM